MQQLFLDAGRVSVLGGWVVATRSFGNPAADAAHVFLGFFLLLVGVLLLTFSPAACQTASFPGLPGSAPSVCENVLLCFTFPLPDFASGREHRSIEDMLQLYLL
jgi:hypothetical protein